MLRRDRRSFLDDLPFLGAKAFVDLDYSFFWCWWWLSILLYSYKISLVLGCESNTLIKSASVIVFLRSLVALMMEYVRFLAN